MDTFMLTSLIPLYCYLGGYASAEVNDREPYLKKNYSLKRLNNA